MKIVSSVTCQCGKQCHLDYPWINRIQNDLTAQFEKTLKRFLDASFFERDEAKLVHETFFLRSTKNRNDITDIYTPTWSKNKQQSNVIGWGVWTMCGCCAAVHQSNAHCFCKITNESLIRALFLDVCGCVCVCYVAPWIMMCSSDRFNVPSSLRDSI